MGEIIYGDDYAFCEFGNGSEEDKKVKKYKKRVLKKSTRNLLDFMLTYCLKEMDNLLSLDATLDNNKDTSDEPTRTLLADMLCRSTNKLIADGLIKKYNASEILTDKPHGKVNLVKSIKKGTYAKSLIYCDIDEYSCNTFENQIIKLALNCLIDLYNDLYNDFKIMEIYYNEIMKKILLCLSYMDEVDDLDRDVEIKNIDVPDYYKTAIAISIIIINQWRTVDKNSQDKKSLLYTLTDERRLAHIVEAFSKQYIKDYLSLNYGSNAYKVTKEACYCYPKKDKDGNQVDIIQVIPDIIIREKDLRRVVILDVKHLYSFMNANEYSTTIINQYNGYRNTFKSKDAKIKYGKDIETIYISGLMVYSLSSTLKDIGTQSSKFNFNEIQESYGKDEDYHPVRYAICIDCKVDEFVEQLNNMIAGFIEYNGNK